MANPQNLLPEKVLIVEDEFMLAVMLQDILETLGVRQVSHAATLADALDLVAREPFDFAFLDINLGKENSIPVARALADRDIRFVFASGYDAKFVAEGISAPLLRKPLGLDEIRTVLTASDFDTQSGRISRIG
ncbi:response regulator [Parasphingopyxis marina]|uniref:Response regulator n=1 Tax=Parasphingopyxis marina TaxID=2761622 RepID=A0A842HWF7_9SPHN|nr:response regulator [Parasphingopyxis marina]MBC2776691.1 response regulator [Parasphingopyxis marina]